MQVFKFPIYQAAEVIFIRMPHGARILSVQIQMSKPCLWALVDPAQPVVNRGIRWAATGETVTALDATTYIGTFQLYGGTEVYHLFDLGES